MAVEVNSPENAALGRLIAHKSLELVGDHAEHLCPCFHQRPVLLILKASADYSGTISRTGVRSGAAGASIPPGHMLCLKLPTYTATCSTDIIELM